MPDCRRSERKLVKWWHDDSPLFGEDVKAIIHLVGEGIKGVPGVAARAFGILGTANINIQMIAQGSSELNLSIVVRTKDAPRAVQLIHQAFERDKA